MSFHPQTPQSPSRFSPVTNDPNVSIGSVTSFSTAFPTPAHSVNGSLSTQPSDIVPETMAAMEHNTPGKRKRATEDMGERESKKVQMEHSSVSIDRLHMDVGQLYMLGRKTYQPPVVDTSEDLFKTFGLTSIASSVARVDEKGEKRSLRKSYKSHLKSLKVDGHFEPVRREESNQDHLLNLSLCPEQEWHVLHVQGREVESGLSPEVMSMLDSACTMNKGSVSSIWDTSVLGDLAPGKTMLKGRSTAPGTPSGGTPRGPTIRVSAAQARPTLDPNRARKNKRALGEGHFEGYGEGHDDEVAMETGYSTAEGDERAPAQKRRKKNPGAPSPFPVRPTQGYGPGMVGA